MKLAAIDLVCSSCGFRCCTNGEQMCKDAVKKAASFCTLEDCDEADLELLVSLSDVVKGER